MLADSLETPQFITLDDLGFADTFPGKFSDKKVLIRVDFNVPVISGVIQDDARIRASLPTLKKLLAAGAKLILISHLGRPKEGEHDENYSLAPVASRLSELLGTPVPLLAHWSRQISFQDSGIVMLENIRFSRGEKANDDELARELAGLCDIYVNDAFATAHRAQASTHGVAKYATVACAGPLLVSEIETINKALEDLEPPTVAIVGGAKASTKLTVLENLIKKVDVLLVGGGIANTFLKAAGFNIGGSLCEDELLGSAAKILEYAHQHNKQVPLPRDVICAGAVSADADVTMKEIGDVEDHDLIVDIGEKTIRANDLIINSAKTLLWNGPVGVFEIEPFSTGTRRLARAIGANPGLSIAGGGDTLSAIAKFGVTDDISYISTGGGAFLELLEGRILPAVDILQQSARAWREKARHTMEKTRDFHA